MKRVFSAWGGVGDKMPHILVGGEARVGWVEAIAETHQQALQMTNYRRYKLKGGTYFFTVNIAERRKALLTDRIDALREAFRQVKKDHPFAMDTVVVFPDHLHTIWTLPEGDDDF